MADDIAVREGKQYGDTEVHSGQVHLGDDLRYYTNNFTINKAIVSLPPQLRRKAERSRGRVQLSRSRTRGNSRFAQFRTERGRQFGTLGRQPGADPRDEYSDNSHVLQNTDSGGSSTRRGGTSGVVLAQNEDSQVLSVNGYESLLVCAALLSYIVGRQVTAQQVLELFHQCRQDTFFPLLTFLFGIVIHNYFCKSIVGKNSPILPCLILEDCYGSERKVGFDVFSDFATVKSFLHTHYTQKKGVAGAQLIQRDQFHLQLKSRQGRVLLKRNWDSVLALLEHGSRVVNSVYVTVETTTCLSCSKSMVAGIDEYHCHACEKSCRDFHSLEAENYDEDEELHRIGSQNTSEAYKPYVCENNRPWHSEPVYGVRELQNLNLKVLPPKTHPKRRHEAHSTGSQSSTARPVDDLFNEIARPGSATAPSDTKIQQQRLADEHQPSKVEITGRSSSPARQQVAQDSSKGTGRVSPRARYVHVMRPRDVHRLPIVSGAGDFYNYSPQPQTPQLRSIVENLLFSLRRYTHAAHCFGHWDPDRALQHVRGRQAARSFASELTAGKSLLDQGKRDLAFGRFELARRRLDNQALFDTWYHETPIRLLFEVSRLSYSGHHDLASQLLQDIQRQSRHHLKDEDPRQAVFNNIGDLNVQQLRALHALAARSVFYGLEAHYRDDRQLLYEVRLNRALDLSWFDPRADLSDWMPSIDQLEHDLGGNTPYVIYFLLLDAYRLVARDEFQAAKRAWSAATQRVELLQETGLDIDRHRIVRGYRRLGQQLKDKKHFEDAGQMLKHALRLLQNESEKSAIMVELCQIYESIAKAVGDATDAAVWTEMLLQLERLLSPCLM